MTTEAGTESRSVSTPVDVASGLLLLDGLLIGTSSLFWLVRGRYFDARFYDTVTGGLWSLATGLGADVERVVSSGVRLAGLLGLMASVFVVTVGCTSFRRREPWAWYVMWSLPAFGALDLALVAADEAITPLSVAWHLAVFALAFAALVLSTAEVFPTNENGARAEAPAPSSERASVQ